MKQQLSKQESLEQVMITSLSALRDKYVFKSKFDGYQFKTKNEEVASNLNNIMLNTMIETKVTCPSCKKGNLICDLCDYEKEEMSIPPTLSNNDAQEICACPVCDGGMMTCDACDYTYDSVKGFNEYVF